MSRGIEDVSGHNASAGDGDLVRLGVSPQQLWVDYIGLGGNLPLSDIDGFLSGRNRLADHDYNIVAQAFNERLMEAHQDQRVPYASEVQPKAPDHSD